MKRFWTTVAVIPCAGGFELALDGKPMRTPAKRALILPTAALAEVLAEEWRAVPADFDPKILGFTRLANTAIDRVADLKADLVEDMVGYVWTDLLCYRTCDPEALAARQAAAWDPVIAWIRDRYNVEPRVTTGLMPITQPPDLAERIRTALQPLSASEIAAFHALTGGFGSIFLCLALAETQISFAEAWAASRIDEAWEVEHWGADAEALTCAQNMESDLARAHRFLVLVQGRD